MLASQPDPSDELQPYWAAWLRLRRDRPLTGGMVFIPRPVPRPMIREEGVRLQYDGDDLDDFVDIVASIDDLDIEQEMSRLAKDSARRKREAERTRRG